MLFGQKISTGAVAGQVTDNDGNPLSAVHILLETFNYSTITDDSGSFFIDHLPAGQQTLIISAVGFEKKKVSVEIKDQVIDLKIQLSESFLKLDPVVVTATRTDRLASELNVPVTVVSKEQIRQSGSLRLADVLSEQTGLAIINDHGAGIQMQGLGSDYTLILINGQPVIGRTAGTLDLNRIAVGNVRQVEIVKGPGSSLYGSEALSGVINIITDQPSTTRASTAIRYGSNNTSDISIDGQLKGDKTSFSLFGNRYNSDGYDLSKESAGQTVEPFRNYTLHLGVTHNFSKKAKIELSGRYFFEEQHTQFNIGQAPQQSTVTGAGEVKDWSISPSITYLPSDRLKLIFRFYGTQYQTQSLLKYETTGKVYDQTVFEQSLYRPEVQGEFFINDDHIVTAGGGRSQESVASTRYQHKRQFSNDYLFVQHEWSPSQKLNITAGGRFDIHSAYHSQFSPKLAIRYNVLPGLSIRTAAGVGFKAPDFRQLYLNFTNTVAGYSVFGSKEVETEVNKLVAEGQIIEVLNDLHQFDDIKAESSLSFNLGTLIQITQAWSADINLFRNNISNLIETVAVARKSNGQAVFSYLNKDRVFTQGVEAAVKFTPTPALLFSLGYQYLIARDHSVLEQLNNREIYARDPATQLTYQVSKKDYGGLFNRSAHMLNFKILFHEPKSGWTANLRVIYRGRYGFADRNGNNILDTDAEYIDGYMTINAALGKTIKELLTLQIGSDNLFNYTNPEFIMGLPGRLIWGSARITINRK